jgi:AraC-like DNA-binding protein
LSLKEIGLSNGFYDAYHFSRSFKEVYGIPPKEYRESKVVDDITQKNPIIRILYVYR